MADGGFTIRDADDDGESKRTPQRQRIIETVLGAGISFWRDADGNAFATVPGQNGETARYRVRSAGFRLLVRALYAQRHPAKTSTGTVPGSVSDSAMAEAIPALEAMGFMGPVREPEVRVMRYQGAVWLDLGGDDWKLVRIASDGWRVVDAADVPLIRPEGLRALPVPEDRQDPKEVLQEMRRLLNVATDTDLLLVVCWLVAALYPIGPYPVLALDGEQGSGKSTICRLLRRLVDPNKADLRAPPRKEDDLLVAAQAGRVVALDNVSFIEADTADALCRLATGGGLSKRRLYTDGDEHIVNVARPILLNGIPSLLARGDLADRALAVTLPHIPDAERRPEAEVMEDFRRAAPGILGLLLDGVATALRNLPGLKLGRLPRMADFARLACAAAPAFGWTADDVLAALEGNRESAVEAVIEADPLAGAIQAIAVDNGTAGWRGTATLLLEAVNMRVPVDVKNERGWPKDGARLSARLKRVQPALRRAGVEVATEREGGTGARQLTIRKAAKAASQASQPPHQRHSVTAASRPERQKSAICDAVTLCDADSPSVWGGTL